MGKLPRRTACRLTLPCRYRRVILFPSHNWHLQSWRCGCSIVLVLASSGSDKPRCDDGGDRSISPLSRARLTSHPTMALTALGLQGSVEAVSSTLREAIRAHSNAPRGRERVTSVNTTRGRWKLMKMPYGSTGAAVLGVVVDKELGETPHIPLVRWALRHERPIIIGCYLYQPVGTSGK